MIGEKSVYEKVQDVSDEYGSTLSTDKLCTKDHPAEDTASICLPGGGHKVLDMLADHGLRVSEIPTGKPDCHKKNHHKRVYVEPI